MRTRTDTFVEIFRAPHPPRSEHFRLLRDEVQSAGDVRLVQDLLLALDQDLARRIDTGGGGDASWAVDLCVDLASANPDATGAAIAALVGGGQLWFHDPVLAVVFEAASQAPSLLSVFSDLVDVERSLLAFRVRAVEALVTRAPGAVGADGVPLDTEPALRFLNAIAEEIDRGVTRAAGESWTRWADAFAGLNRLFPENREPEVLGWVGEALSALALAPAAPETMRIMLRILRANTPLPSWRPATSGGDGGADAVGALIVDKAIQAVLSAASMRWRPAATPGAARPPRLDVELWPFSEKVLEATLVDGSKPPRARAAAAGLLHVLSETNPAVRLSAASEVYADLFLAPHRRAGAAVPPLDADPRRTEERLDVLLDATNDACAPLRHAALERCRQLATEHAASFQPRHYTRLLPLLSDDDAHIRVSAMKTFQALAGFRSRRVATVVGDITARLHGETAAGEEEVRARHDLEVALGVTMDRLVDDVEQLQAEVESLEARRSELLDYIEAQAIRVGEEIHHEVLNSLTGYLATAIDEQDYAEAGQWLGALIQELRRIMNNLYPRDLETEGFLATVRKRLNYAKGHLDRRGQPCSVSLEWSPEVTDAAIERCVGGRSHLVLLYRIVLEAINNARKHSRGTFIGVSVQVPAPDALEIRITDNGQSSGGPFGENAGMALMRRRAEEIAAAIEYEPTPGGGTTVVVRLPAVRPPRAPEGGGEAVGREARGDGQTRAQA